METKAVKPGDLIVFVGAQAASGPSDIMGLVIDEDRADEHPAVFVQFYGDVLQQWAPVHYYCDELDTFLLQGDIRIIRGE